MKNNNPFHFIGIGGIGMSALARILLDKKAKVSGSDLKSSLNLQELAIQGAKIFPTHNPSNIPRRATVIYSSGIDPKNPELLAAKGKVLHRSQLLAELAKGHKVVAVAGTHGKTTVTALLSYVLMHAGKDPSFAVGGMLDLKNIFSKPINGRQGKGGLFVLEADESDGSFLNYYPEAAIITSIESDHLDYYKNDEKMREAFAHFRTHISGPCYYYGDDPSIAQTLKLPGISYGFGRENTLWIKEFIQEGWNQTFSVVYKNQKYLDIAFSATGKHNALNAAAAFGLLLDLGLSQEEIRTAYQSFPGVHRRCEKKGEAKTVLFIDDYAHHPTEIRTTLQAINQAVSPRRLIAIFQPHRYTRTRDLLEEFSKAFECADRLFITDIYPAGEKPIPEISSEIFLKALAKNSCVQATYLPIDKAPEMLYNTTLPGDVIVTLGAGSITHLHNDLIPFFQSSKHKKLKVGLISGGRSCEHEVSLETANAIRENLDLDLFEPIDFIIDKQGYWNGSKKTPLSQEVLEKLHSCDVLFPMLHGPMGEDGTIQGFFEILGKPYVGANYRACALCMDKVLAKKMAEAQGIPILPFIAFDWLEWEKEHEKIKKRIQKELTFPLFVKPIHLGSSVGITKVTDWKNLEKAIAVAFIHDDTILVEQGLEAPRELEFAALENTIPLPGELQTKGAVYDYEGKYGPNAIGVDLYPKLTEAQKKAALTLVQKVYAALGATPMARIDFLLDTNGKFWFNEINPIPGFTGISMYPKIWEREGLTLKKLITKLIYLGLKRGHRTPKLLL